MHYSASIISLLFYSLIVLIDLRYISYYLYLISILISIYKGPPWATDQVIGHPTSVAHNIVVKL